MGETVRHGFSEEELRDAHREQHIPDTCWAACLAMGSGLLGVRDENNEFRWFNRAKANSQVQPNGRILEADFLTLATHWNQTGGHFKIKIYKKEDIAAQFSELLGTKKVVMLWSEQHAVILGAIEFIEGQREKARFRILDPARGGVETWDLMKVVGFTAEYVVVMG